jgi:hypothetical protein
MLQEMMNVWRVHTTNCGDGMEPGGPDEMHAARLMIITESSLLVASRDNLRMHTDFCPGARQLKSVRLSQITFVAVKNN